MTARQMESLQELLEKLEYAHGFEEFSKLRGSIEPKILKSRDAGLLCQLGGIYRDWKLWQDAEDVFQQAMRLEPSLPNPHRSLGLLLIHRDDLDWQESLERAKKALETSAHLERLNHEASPATHTLLGRACLSLGERARAISEFRTALEIDSRYTEAKYNLATALDLLQPSPTNEIIDLLKQCVEEEPDYFIALRDLGWQLRHSSLIEAQHYLAKALEHEQDDVLAHIYYARLKFDNEPIIAEKHYKKAIELDPGDAELHRLLGLFYKQHNRPEDANREFFSAIELDPRDERSVMAYVDFLRGVEAQARSQLYLSVKKSAMLPEQASRDLDMMIARL